jgi:hypothetical protein
VQVRKHRELRRAVAVHADVVAARRAGDRHARVGRAPLHDHRVRADVAVPPRVVAARRCVHAR